MRGTVTQPGEPLLHQLAGWADRQPDAPAVTFVDYQADPQGRPAELTWRGLHQRALGLADRLRRVAGPGERVAVLAPSGTEYVVALFAAWYAGTVAVPLFPPGLPGHADRLVATFEDCAPRCVVTVPDSGPEVREFVAGRRHRATVVVTDGTETSAGTGWRPAPVAWDDVAYLQYSSGSTRVPAGVEITHGNLTANVHQMCAALTGGRTRFTGVSWLPLFHDMGLLTAVGAPLWAGTDTVLFDPVAFLMHPVRWLRLLSGRPAAFTAAPNFAYDYCLRRLTDADLVGLDLTGVFLWLDGAEPVRAATMERFATRLAGTGLDPRTVCAGYGLAEATLFVAAHPNDRPTTVARFDQVRLAAGEAVPVPDGRPATVLVSCGRPAGQQVAIVDPEHRTALPEGRVGEIWVSGPNVARRYRGQPERSTEVFDAVLAPPVPDGLPAGPWLRTGDLGVRHGGELFVTGRLKDLLIVAGRNHYPQDVEETVAAVSPAVGRVAAFSVPVDGQERVVVLAERSRSAAEEAWDPTELARLARQAVWRRHDLALHDVVCAEPGLIARTTSGKVSRTACRQRYLAAAGAPAGQPVAGEPVVVRS